MKKRILKTACLLCTAILAFSLSGCGTEKTYKPSADASWGDLCRHFEPKWFDSLPEQLQNQYDELVLGEVPEKEKLDDMEIVSSMGTIYKESEGDDAGYSVFGNDESYFYDSEDMSGIAGRVLNFIAVNEQDKSLDYIASVCGIHLENQVQMSAVIALSDPKTGEYLEIKTVPVQDNWGTGENEQWQGEGKFENVKHGSDYKIEMLAVVEPPQGLESTGALYIAKDVAAEEPSKDK